MKTSPFRSFLFAAVFSVGLLVTAPAMAAKPSKDPLPSWNAGSTKNRITTFVHDVVRPGGPLYVPPAARIAVFDNDGTLWVEQPLYTQVQFAMDRVKAMAPDNPSFSEQQPFRAILENDREAMAKFTEKDLAAIITATHTGMSPEEFHEIASAWLQAAKHPRFGRLYTECVYQPMLELMAYLRQNQFKTFIVSGGETDFMRAFTPKVYGVPPEQVVGSSFATKFEIENDGYARLVRTPKLFSLDDGPGKAMNIHLHIGQRPIFAFGNSDGDVAMLQYTDSGNPGHLALLLHHDDAEREYAYDRNSHIGRLARGFEEAEKRGWLMVSMKEAFRRIFPFELPGAREKSP